MITELLCIAATIVLAGAQADSGPVAHWDLDEGAGEETRDRSANAIAGRVRGAEWAECGEGWALAFNKEGAHVNCGHPPSLDITGPVSLEAWVYPRARAACETGIAGKSFDSYAFSIYGDGNFYWYISSGGNKCSTPATVSRWSHLVGTFDGVTMKLYVNGELKDARASQFDTVKSGRDFFIGRIARYAADGVSTDSFNGFVSAVRVYDRALNEQEIHSRYDQEKARQPRMEKGLDRVVVTPYFYFDAGEAFVDVDAGTLVPFAEDERAELTLWRTDPVEHVQRLDVAPDADSGVARDIRLDMSGLTPGAYEIRAAVLKGAEVVAQDKAAFVYPRSVEVPAPDVETASPLPSAPEPPAYELVLEDGGGFRIALGGETYPVVSTYSYPHGGENRLASAGAAEDGEACWRVAVHEPGGDTYRVEAEGAFYAIDRRVLPAAHRVLVKDTITNKIGEPLGIILSNRIDASGKAGTWSSGFTNPAVFLSDEDRGVGLVALDDVYLEQHERFFESGVAGLRTRTFALDAGASYTLEWAVYLNGTGDYYDCINAIRKDEGLVRRVDGCFAFMDRREAPTKEFVELRALKYASIPCLSHSADDEGLSIEGIEFTEYPEECRLLKETFAETRKRHPDLKVMFHVAHSLYATDKPDELFPDSRTLNASENQTDYGGNNVQYYRKYFSKEHVDEGYRWFIFYPAKDNAFGKAMLEATDFMLDELGVTGMFGDGLTHGYGGRFTYDRWDGHTAEIDPETKTIRRKYASVNLLADPILVEVIRKINARGGVVIANSYPGTRTAHKEDLFYCIETTSGDQTLTRLYLCPTVIGLGDPARIECERDVYDDIRSKLEWGGLYFYYGEKEITRPTVTAQMYPITVEEIHKGMIKGPERVITTRPGVYGWHGERALHLGYRYDGRGVLAGHDFLTSVDGNSVRTNAVLGDRDTAVIKKIPATIEAGRPLNLVARQYDADGFRCMLNGSGEVRLSIKDGAFKIEPGASYVFTTGGTQKTVQSDGETLALSFTLDGQTDVEVTRSPAT